MSKSALKNAAFAELNQIEWQPKKIPNNEIKSEFTKMASSSSKSQRVKDMATKLFESNNYQTT
jgi:hypothetical protein